MNRLSYVVLAGLAVLTAIVLALWSFVDGNTDSSLHRWLVSSGFDLALISFKLAVATVAMALPAGVVLAALVARTNMWGRGIAEWFLLSLMFLPLYLQAAAWNAGFGRLGWYSLSTGPLVEPLLSGFHAAVWVHAMASIPWIALIVSVALRTTERNLEEQALLHWSPLRVFLSVTLPRIVPALIVAILWTALSTTGEMVVTDIFQVRAYAEVLYSGFALTPDGRRVTAELLPGIVFVGLLTLGAFALAMTYAAQTPRLSYGPPLVFHLKVWRWPATATAWGLLLMIGGVPLGNLVYKAGVVATLTEGERVRTWSLAKFTEILAGTPMRFGEAFGWTLLVAACAATATTAIAIPLAWLARDRRWAAIPALLLTALFLAVPGPLVGLSVEWILNRDVPPLVGELYDTVFAPVLSVTCRALPLAILTLWFSLRTVHRQTLESAAIDGVGRIRMLTAVVLPQRWRSLLLTWVIAFAVAAGDLSWTSLVLPADVVTVPFQVFALIHSGVRYDEAAICLYMVAAVFLVSGLLRITWHVTSRK